MVLGHDILSSVRTQDIKISENVSFDSMLLSPKILNGLKSSGFYVPSPIQLHGIPLGKCGFDLLLEAKSGTGKTAVFVIIALEKLNLNKGLQTLMLAPTREIASQICDVIKTIGAYFEGLTVEVVMGGLPFAEDVEKFKKTVHIVVGSPGRLYHLIKNKHIDVSTVRLMVLDEADKLLEKSFLSDINKIFSLLPSLKQMIMSSATYPDDIKTTMKNYVLNAHHICPDSNSVLLGIEQNVTIVPGHVNIVKQTKNRYTELNKILTKKKFKQCLVFCNYQVRVGEVHKMLIKDEWPADKLHGKQQQTDRLEALKILQEYKCRILVSTDLAARGIDASNIDLVVNFEIPFDWQTYLHRIGRAGRFGSYGSAVTILCEDEQNKFRLRLQSLDIPFNLKHLWSNEPFLLDLSKTVEKSPCKEENKSLPEIKESVRNLETNFEKVCDIEENESLPEIKESVRNLETSFDKVCEVLSVDSIKTSKEIHDIPTLKSLCESFEGVNRDFKVDSIESFSDLCTSFHSHELKGNDNLNFKALEDHELIIPCNMFNGNIILQSFQKHKSSTSYGKPCGSSHKSETLNNNVSFPSTSKGLESKTSTKSKTNKETKVENVCSTFGKIEAPTRKVFLGNETSDSKNNCSESVAHKSDSDHEQSFISPEYNDCERALLAANLPTAFGKSKQNRMQSTINRDIRKKNHFSSHSQNIRNNEHHVLLIDRKVITKSKETDFVYETSDSNKAEDELVSQSHKPFGGRKSYKDTSLNHKTNKTVIKKNNVKQATIVYESSEDERTEIEPLPCKSQKDKMYLKSHNTTRKQISNQGKNNYYNDFRYRMHSSVVEERQRQFDCWYQELQTNMQVFERLVYMEEMKRLNKFY